MASPSTDTITHPTLRCTLRGAPSLSTIQFRNIKYASIPARYQESLPNDSLKTGSDNIFDATRFGASCPHKRGAQAWDLTLTGSHIITPYAPGQGATEAMDEFECLNLNVTVPKSVLSSPQGNGKGLPVFVWIHGGGLCIGSNSWPQYDLQRFVEHSVLRGRPVIGVAMNYRLNMFGFAASADVGAKGNMGFKDQVLAFRWVRKHIAGFGGDPQNITALGESAGGISVSTLLCADVDEGLFERAVVMSGDATLRKSRTTWWQQMMYEDQAKFLGLERDDREGLRRVMLETDAEELAQKLPLSQHTCGHVDGEWLKEDANLHSMADGEKTLHKPDWCKEFVIGDTADDGTILRGRILDTPKVLERLRTACSTYLSSAESQRLLAAYELDGTPSPEQETQMVRALASELRFYVGTMAVHDGWKGTTPPKRASRYHFHVPNPFEGVNKDLASHELDVVLLFQNLNHLLDDKYKKISHAISDQFLKYIHGEGWVADGKILVYEADGIVQVAEDEYDAKYRGGRGAVLRSMDAVRLWKIVEMWCMVRSEDDEPEIASHI